MPLVSLIYLHRIGRQSSTYPQQKHLSHWFVLVSLDGTALMLGPHFERRLICKTIQGPDSYWFIIVTCVKIDTNHYTPGKHFDFCKTSLIGRILLQLLNTQGYYLDKSDNQHQAYVDKNKRNPEQSCGISDIFSCVKHTVFPL